jgi:mannose/fructose-specific phosphotransferase system component IIA
VADNDFFDFSQPHVRRSMVLLASGALCGLLIAGYGLFTAKGTRSRSVPPEAVALVNQRAVLRSDFMTQAQSQFSVAFDQVSAAQRRKVLNDMVDEELMMQRGLEIDLPSYDPEVRAALVAGVELEVGADVLAQQPTEAELHRYYTEHQDQYSSEGVLRLRDLIVGPPLASATVPVAAQAGASAAVAALRAGMPLEAAMSRFALRDSGRFMDTGHVDTGEIFDFAVKAKLEERLYQQARVLKSGEISEPILIADGTHILVVLEHRFPVAQSYEQAANKVWTDFKNAAQTKVRAANLQYLRGRADILLAPEYAR